MTRHNAKEEGLRTTWPGEDLPMSSDEHEISERFVKAFEVIRPLYKNLASEIEDLLITKMSREDLKVSVTSRVKELDSFRQKIVRKAYADPIREVTDLAGCRIVCSYDSDISRISKIVESLFEVCEIVDKTNDLGVDKMG